MKTEVTPEEVCPSCGHTTTRAIYSYHCEVCKADLGTDRMKLPHILRLRYGDRDAIIGLKESDEFYFCDQKHLWRWITQNEELIFGGKYQGVSIGWGQDFYIERFRDHFDALKGAFSQ